MDSLYSFWQLGDELRGHLRTSEDHKWLLIASKLAEQKRLKGERLNNLDLSKDPIETRSRDKFGYQEDNRFDALNMSMLNADSKITENVSRSSLRNGGIYNMNVVYPKNKASLVGNMNSDKYGNNVQGNESNNSNSGNSHNDSINTNAADKRFKTLPASEALLRNEVLGGYIFVCNNDTNKMEEDLKRQLFGLRIGILFEQLHQGCLSFCITIPLISCTEFLRQQVLGALILILLHGRIKKGKGESRFPSQVRIRVRKLCKALEEDSFRPVLHHYDGPKFRL